MIKTASVLENTYTQKTNPLIAQKVVDLAKPEAILTDDITIFSGISNHSSITICGERGFRTWNNGEFHFNQIHEDGFSFGIQLNNLLLRVVKAPGENTKRVTKMIPLSDGRMLLPWVVMPKFKYKPEKYSHTFPDFMCFYNMVEVMTHVLIKKD